MSKFGYLGSKYLKTNVKFGISIFEIGCRQNFVERLESWFFLAQNTQIWAFGLEIWKRKDCRKFQISPIFFSVVLQFFWVILAGFGSFWLVLGFSNYDNLIIHPSYFLTVLKTQSPVCIALWSMITGVAVSVIFFS